MSKGEGGLTAERILDAAEQAVARHGPAKANVVDVAQALGVSHGSIYRFFPSKAALRQAVVARWVGRVAASQATLVLTGSAADRLKAWFQSLQQAKFQQKAEDPELFEAFRTLSAEARGPIRAYRESLEGQVARILAEGQAAGQVAPLEPRTTARALLNATLRFYHPSFAADWGLPELQADFEDLWAVLARGIFLERTLV